MKKITKVVSLFDGGACARQALKKLGHKINSYVAAEIDLYAKNVAIKNHPDIIHVGSVLDIHPEFDSSTKYKNVDLMIGGSPCQDLSIAKAGRKGLDGEKSGLFYEYVRILKEVQPEYFILENVASMSKESKDKISEELGGGTASYDKRIFGICAKQKAFVLGW